MGDRNLVHYEEERNAEGPYWTLDIERSAAGQPRLLFTIETKTFSEDDRHIESLNRQMTIVVEDGVALLAPVLNWLDGRIRKTPEDIAGEIMRSQYFRDYQQASGDEVRQWLAHAARMGREQ